MEVSEGMRLALQQCRKRLGEPGQRKRIRRDCTRCPDWLTADMAEYECHAHQQALLERGQVVWGALVQANNMLFEPGRHDHPGMIVYSADPRMDAELPLLWRAAEALRSSRAKFEQNENSPRDLTYIARVLAAEDEPLFQHPAPADLCEGIPSFIGTLLFPRRHLPNRVLHQNFFPVLIDPAHHRTVALLPCRFWPEYLLDYWKPHWNAA